MLTEAGFQSAEIMGKTGYATSKFTAAYYLVAVR